MGDAFVETSEIGQRGEDIVSSLLRTYNCDVRETPKTMEDQLKYADFVVPGIKQLGIGHEIIEVKTELIHTGNLFFETVSNDGIDRAGWAYTSTANTMYYLFMDVCVGYRIPEFQTVMWHFDYHKNSFIEKPQTRRVQSNLSKGKLVPVGWVMECYGVTKFSFIDPQKSPERGEQGLIALR
jgi:hypothetical protein